MALVVGQRYKVEKSAFGDCGTLEPYKSFDNVLLEITSVDDEDDFTYDILVDGRKVDNCDYCLADEQLILEGDNMADSKVTAKQIRESALSVEDQLLLDNDIVNAEGALTENGEGVVLQVLFTTNKDAVVAAVKAIADAQKATATK